MPTFTFEEIEFIVPDWILSPIVNGDFDALTDEECLAVEWFCDKTANMYGNAFFILKENLDFTASNDFDSLAGNCSTVIILKDV